MKKLKPAGKLLFSLIGAAMIGGLVFSVAKYVDAKNTAVDMNVLRNDALVIQTMKDNASRKLARDTYIRFNDRTEIEYGSAFAPSWLIADCSGEVMVEGEVNSRQVGDYSLHYTVNGEEESFGYATQKEYDRSIKVVDTQYPVIELYEDSVTIEAEGEVNKGANVYRAYDVVDGDVDWWVEGEVDASKAGDYVLMVYAQDQNGNVSSRNYTVTVKEKPKPVVVAAAKGGVAPDVIYNYLTGTMGLNKAAACGIMGNMWAESNFVPTAGNYYYGLCQWGGGRRASLESWCPANGYDYSTAEGQLAYMYHELQTGYSGCLNNLRAVEDSEQGAANAAIIFVHQFEGAASEGNRAALAVGYYNNH